MSLLFLFLVFLLSDFVTTATIIIITVVPLFSYFHSYILLLLLLVFSSMIIILNQTFSQATNIKSSRCYFLTIVKPNPIYNPESEKEKEKINNDRIFIHFDVNHHELEQQKQNNVFFFNHLTKLSIST